MIFLPFRARKSTRFFATIPRDAVHKCKEEEGTWRYRMSRRQRRFSQSKPSWRWKSYNDTRGTIYTFASIIRICKDCKNTHSSNTRPALYQEVTEPNSINTDSQLPRPDVFRQCNGFLVATSPLTHHAANAWSVQRWS
jgi:hypothetical protein